MKKTAVFVLSVSLMSGAALLLAQEGRPLSPRGTAATQVGGVWSEEGRPRYTDGKWIEIDYGRPILRGREDLFGSGEEYGKRLNAGAPVWRAGANQSTRFSSEIDLELGDAVLPAGEYSLFIDLQEGAWTLILSRLAAQERYDPNDKDAVWGAYGYTQEMDALRAPMQLGESPYSVDQLTFGFIDMTQKGGKLAVWWDRKMATIPFAVAE